MKKLFLFLSLLAIGNIFFGQELDQKEIDELYPMVEVCGGSFEMGSNNGDNSEKPVHKVVLSTFEMGKTEVTQELYEKVMEDNPSYYKGDKKPVIDLSWYDILYFCNELSILAGYEPCYIVDGETDPEEWDYEIRGKTKILSDDLECDFEANGYRLPTEAEWEYAAKEGNLGSQYSYSGSDDIDAVAWYYDNKNGGLHEVACKKPNALGIYDMTGNVWEYCWDFYDYDYYSISPEENPTGPDGKNSVRVVRGGDFVSKKSSCRNSARTTASMASMTGYTGIRLVRSFSTSEANGKNPEYIAKFNRGKAYEQEGKWIYALGSYYDAIEAGDLDEVEEAYEAYNQLADAIMAGNPGYGEFDEFDMHDGWKDMHIEYEDYWTDNCPRQFIFGKLTKSASDYATRTTSYTLNFELEWTPKYLCIKNILEKGYKLAYQKDWKDLESEWSGFVINRGRGIYEYKSYSGPLYFLASTYTGNNRFTVSFKITDISGNELIGLNTVNNGETITIKGIPQDISKQLKDNNIIIAVDNIKMNYDTKKYITYTNAYVKTPYDTEDGLVDAVKAVADYKAEQEKLKAKENSTSQTGHFCEESNDVYKIYMEYPSFSDYPEFSEQIEDFINDMYIMEHSTLYEAMDYSPYDLSYYLSYEIYESDDYLSVLFRSCESGVGAHDQEGLTSMIINKNTGSTPSLTSLTGKSYALISNECRKILLQRGFDDYFVENATMPDEWHFSVYAVQDNKVKVFIRDQRLWNVDGECVIEFPLVR